MVDAPSPETAPLVCSECNKNMRLAKQYHKAMADLKSQFKDSRAEKKHLVESLTWMKNIYSKQRKIVADL